MAGASAGMLGTNLDGSVGVGLLVEGDGAVDEQEADNEGKVGVVEQADGEDSSSLHCPGQGVPHVAKVDEDGVPGALRQLVGAVLDQTRRRLLIGQAMQVGLDEEKGVRTQCSSKRDFT